METIETLDVAGLRVSIYPDSDPMSPREWDNLGTIRTWHRRYTIGDEEASDPPGAPSEPEHWAEYLDDAGALYLPVYLYDHSGLSLSTGAFACPWDSGQIGYVYVLPDKLREEYGALEWASDATRERALSCLRGEVETLSQFLSGDVYGYVVERIEPCGDDCDGADCDDGPHETESLDSCWGFFGSDAAKAEGRGVAQSIADAPAQAAAEAYARSYIGQCAVIAERGS